MYVCMQVELADSQTTETDLDQMARTDAKEFLEDLDSNKDNFLSVEELASQYTFSDESDNDSSDNDSDDFKEYLRDFEDRSEYDDFEDKNEYDDGTDDNDDGTDDNEYESEFIEDSYKEEQYPGEEDAAAAEALTAFKAPYTDEAESADNTDEADSADNTDEADSTGQY